MILHKSELEYTTRDNVLSAKMTFDYNERTYIFSYRHTLYNDVGTFKLYGVPGVPGVPATIKDLTALQENELFQLSLVWEHDLPIELLQSMQSFMLESEGLWSKRNKFECTIQY